MEIEVTPKKWYVVSGTAGATVTKPDGTVIATVPDGGQTAFLATTYTVLTSDSKVEVVDSTFNFALASLGWQGGGNTTPMPQGYLPALFLESDATPYIDTGITLNGDSVVSFTYQNVDIGVQHDLGCIFGARESTTLRVFTYYDRIYVTGGSMYFGYNNTSANIGAPLASETVTHVEIDGPSWRAVNTVRTLQHEFVHGEFETYTAYLFTFHDENGADSRGYSGRIYNCRIGTPTKTQRDFVPALDENGVPCMFDKVTKQPFYNSGTGAFIVGLKTEQARLLCFLPYGDDGTTLTVSLPSAIVNGETVTDALVQSALDAAAAKGWDITIQTYTES